VKEEGMAFDFAAALVQTEALRIAPPGQLFWYTSGTVGPYYINTHYLYGNPQKAEELLAFIDAGKEDRKKFPGRLMARVRKNYAEDAVYRQVVDLLAARVREEVGDGFDCVSGGERRDWFFSPAVAAQLGKPHLFIYKDLSAALFDDGIDAEPDLTDRRTVHVADLVTEASSYLRAWVPAVENRGGRIVHAFNVVDRAQGGGQALVQAGVPASALFRIDEDAFEALLQAGHVDEQQQQVLNAYYRDPHGSMKRFLEENPDFLREALASPDERTAARARMLVEQNLYGLDVGE